jgi:NADH-quinone oxidoreductase subunit A
MSSHNLDVYMPILILIGIGVALVFGAMLIGKLIRPHNPTRLKVQAYECGEDPVGVAWSNFNVRFYVVSLIFIIFDVEGALMFPVASIFKKFNEVGRGGLVLCTLSLFVLILAAGIIYCWRKGDLDWVKSFHLDPNQEAESTSTQEAS